MFCSGQPPVSHATVTVSRRDHKGKPQTWTATLTRWLAKVQKKGFREFERKRRNWPGLNFIMEYGIKQVAAALFLADIVCFWLLLCPLCCSWHHLLASA
jgi:hypothetical protein